MSKRALLFVAGVAAGARVVFSILQVYGVLHPLPYPFGPSLFADFSGIYIPQVKSLSSGLLPYTGFGYSFTPLFIFSLLPFYYFGGAYAAAVPTVLSDALTAPLVYAIVRARGSQKMAMGTGLAYALMPLALINEGYLWLGNQPGLLFMALSIYFFESKEKTKAMIALGISAMFRQEFMLLALPFLALEYRNGWRSVGKWIVEISAVVLLISAPFLILAPSSYLSEISYGLVSLAHEAPTSATSLSSQGLHFLQSCYASISSSQYCVISTSTGPPPWYDTYLKLTLAFELLSPILFLLGAAGLYVIRRAPDALELACAEALTGLFLVFQWLVHSVFAYYFLPVYAVLLAGGRDWRTLAAVSLAGAASVVSPEGWFQLFICTATLLAYVALTDYTLGGGEMSRQAVNAS